MMLHQMANSKKETYIFYFFCEFTCKVIFFFSQCPTVISSLDLVKDYKKRIKNQR